MSRKAKILRKTKETNIAAEVNLDGKGKFDSKKWLRNNTVTGKDPSSVNEENVNVDTKEPDESFVQKETVDLGYTDVTGGKTAKELLQETKEKPEEKPEPIRKSEEPLEQKVEEEDRGDLEEYSDKVQKRIKNLVEEGNLL